MNANNFYYGYMSVKKDNIVFTTLFDGVFIDLNEALKVANEKMLAIFSIADGYRDHMINIQEAKINDLIFVLQSHDYVVYQ